MTNLASDQVGTTIANYAYAVGPTGIRTNSVEQMFASMLNTQAKTINRTYTYDSIYRLTSESISINNQPSTINYGYDPVGNRLSRGITGLSLLPQSFSFDPNDRLNNDTYDANGNTLIGSGFGQIQADGYDFENRLISRHTPLCTVTIQYDGDGNRISKTVTSATNSVTTFYVVDDLNPSGYAQVLEEHVSLNSQPPTLNCTYTYGHMSISQNRFKGVQWALSFYGYDGHNNVRYLTDMNGNVTDTYDYDAFGNLIAQTGSTLNNCLFTGEQYDPDLGLYYIRVRYHNTDTGRFWTMDTYEGIQFDPGSLHKYIYTKDNPINRTDPSGHIDEFDQLAATKVATTLAQTEANIGFATFNQLMYGGNAGLKSLVVGGVVQLSIPAVLIAAGKFRAIAGLFIGGLTEASSLDYQATFFEEYPWLKPYKDQIEVHHAIERQVLEKYPGVFTEYELNFIDNLRGIPKELVGLHRGEIRRYWDIFYRENPTATKEQLLEYAAEIDNVWGRYFVPPLL